mmetsp:Transcript_2237/g.4248  ORF Transcript_2237/g.4248 Transcript_2237/m.4248 type:complete len:696 (-) Transcript_2237:455-2542(-)
MKRSLRLAEASSVEEKNPASEGENGSATTTTGTKKTKKDNKAGSGFDTRWRFKIESQPPKFPFLNRYFELNIFLVDQEGILQPNYEVPINLELYVEGESAPVTTEGQVSMGGSKGSMMVDPATPPVIGPSGNARIRVMVRELSMNRNNRKFCLVVKRKPGPRGKLPREINPTMTRAMLVINSKIKITNHLPEVWFKDQGGRDKCLELDLELHGPEGLVTGVNVPVRCVLLYEDFTPAISQDFLQPSPSTIMAIDETGRSKIRVRIEDVSKNHRSKNFRIRVEADTTNSPIHFDKAPDVSTPVLVRSKLNRRQKIKLAQQLTTEAQAGIAGRATQVAAAAGSALASTLQNTNYTPPNQGLESNAMRNLNSIQAQTPQVGLALWAHTAREALGTLSVVLGQLAGAFDDQLASFVHSELDQVDEPSFRFKTSVSRDSVNGLHPMKPGAGTAPGSNPNAVSLLPSESVQSNGGAQHAPHRLGDPNQSPPLQHAKQDFERGVSSSSFSSQNLSTLLRGTTQLLRGLSSSFPVNNNENFSGPPMDFRRDLSMLSMSQFDAPSMAPGRSPSGGVPRLHSLLPSEQKRSQSAGTELVAFLLKKEYRIKDESGDVVFGLPAFCSEGRLLGFYSKAADDMVNFTNVDAALDEQHNKPDHIMSCEKELDRSLASRSSLVYSVRGQEEGYSEAARTLTDIYKVDVRP